MKFKRTNIKISSKTQTVDIKTCLVQYIQSYLNWLYTQNPSFAKTLDNEELSNFLFHQIETPVWFQYLFKTNTFKILIEVNNYISKYKKNANLMEDEFPVETKNKTIKYTIIDYPLYAVLNESQKSYMDNLCKNLGVDKRESYLEIDYQLCKQVEAFNKQIKKELRYA